MWLRQLLVFLLCSSALWAEVVRIEIHARSEVLGGRTFGLAGPYEKLVGKVYFAVDPGNPINQIIADINKAPRNAAGKVEFSSDLYVLKPKNPERGNGAVLCDIPNRGRKVMLSFFNRAPYSLDPSTGAEFGDGFLMRQGYTLVWLGWQWDPPPRPGLMRLYAPVARGIQGLVRADFVVTQRVTRRLLSDRNHIPYRVADPDDPQATLTVRDRVDLPRRLIPRKHWKFSADRTSVEMPAGFEPHKIYEVVYTGKDPVLVGLGPTAVRDFLSHLKYEREAAPGAPPEKPLIPGIRRAYAFGISQSGRFLRTFLYYGFNQDEAGRKVLDGIIPHVAGASRGSFNHRFAQPSRDAHPFMNFFYPTVIFPFTDVAQTDPETGLTDGLLRRARDSGTAPRIFHTNASYEYWGRAASLIHTSLDGKSDAPILTMCEFTCLPARSTALHRSRPHARSGSSATTQTIFAGPCARCWWRWISGSARMSRRHPASTRASRTGRWCRLKRWTSQRFPEWATRRGCCWPTVPTTGRSGNPGSSRGSHQGLANPSQRLCHKWMQTEMKGLV